MEAVYNKEEHVLVNAGAGCGKSTTILGKVAYLLESKQAAPEEILLLSYTTATVNDLNNKINQYGLGKGKLKARTFHGLGFSDTIKKYEPNVAIADENFNLLDIIFRERQDKKEAAVIFDLMLNFYEKMFEYGDGISGADYAKYLDNSTYEDMKQQLASNRKTLGGYKVKSLPELRIANWLFENGIKYEYEKNLEHKNGTSCRPDFYLPDYDIYIEHWGVERDGNGNECVPWLRDDNGNIKEQNYLENKRKKLKLYAEDGINLINVHLYEFKNNTLIDTLRQKLEIRNVSFDSPLTDEQKIQFVRDMWKRNKLEGLKKKIDTFLALFKSKGYSTDKDLAALEEKTRNLMNTEYDRQRCSCFFSLFKWCLHLYQDKLGNRIDYSDMLLRATKYIESGQVTLPYKYIIIDEYQDISEDLYRLVKAIKDKNDAKIFCVGDDWQSIYRFKGSDVNFFTKFETFFPYHKDYLIGTTFRNAQNIIDLSSSFVQRNPAQMRKNIFTDKAHEGKKTLLQTVLYKENDKEDTIAALDDLIENIVIHKAELQNEDGNIDVLLLLRNWIDIFILGGPTWFVDGTRQDTIVRYKKYPFIKFKVNSVHGSKGLESPVVILLNMKHGTNGFPSEKTDDKLFAGLLVEPDKFPYAEERRLFYVALTRTKNACYLFVPTDKTSDFYPEIANQFEVIRNPDEGGIKCPIAGCGGHLVLREKNGHQLWGCSNYGKEYTGCNFTIANPNILQNAPVCPKCGGHMVKRHRNSDGQQFYGCVNYFATRCDGIINIED